MQTLQNILLARFIATSNVHLFWIHIRHRRRCYLFIFFSYIMILFQNDNLAPILYIYKSFLWLRTNVFFFCSRWRLKKKKYNRNATFSNKTPNAGNAIQAAEQSQHNATVASPMTSVTVSLRHPVIFFSFFDQSPLKSVPTTVVVKFF